MKNFSKDITILVIEDSDINSLLIKSLFEDDFDYKIKIAKNGDDGLNDIRNLKPDIVLLDLMLPDIDGYKILEFLKQNNETKNIPVFIISAKDQKKDIDKAMQLGAVDFILKPIGTNKMLERVTNYIENNILKS